MITGRIGAERKFNKNPKAMHGAIVDLLRVKANRIDWLEPSEPSSPTTYSTQFY